VLFQNIYRETVIENQTLKSYLELFMYCMFVTSDNLKCWFFPTLFYRPYTNLIDCIGQNGWMIINSELGEVWKKAVVTCFTVFALTGKLGCLDTGSDSGPPDH
jgi:hypothetical protein